MLLGEHAVLHGRRALACAVNRRISVQAEKTEGNTLVISSPLGRHETTLDALEETHDFRFVIEAVRCFRDRIQGGLSIEITSEFASDIGLGSSAAVTVATVGALAAALEDDTSSDVLFRTSRQVVREVQQTGSGTDVAASVYGGVIGYRMEPIEITPCSKTPPITLVYSGHKEPTVNVIRHVETRREEAPELFEGLFDLMDQSVAHAVDAVNAGRWSDLGTILNINQGLMDGLGVNSRALSDIVFALRNEPGIYGAKISGSGLGDCVVGIGEATLSDAAYDLIGVQISEKGIRFEQV
jgi:mevalonate kinase